MLAGVGKESYVLLYTALYSLLADAYLLYQLLRSTPSEFRVVRAAARTRRRH